MIRKTGMKIRLEINSFGHLTMTPVAESWQNRIKDYLESWDTYWDNSVYLQSDYSIDAAMDDCGCTTTERNDLDHGWSVVKLLDPWVFGQGYIGYDAGDRNFIPLP